MREAFFKALLATSEPLRALILAFVVVFLRELLPGLDEVPLEALLAPLIGYMVAKGLAAVTAGSGAREAGGAHREE
jgi:hypothetical protein